MSNVPTLLCAVCGGAIGIGACRWVMGEPHHFNCSPKHAGRIEDVRQLQMDVGDEVTPRNLPDANPKTAFGVRKPSLNAIPPVALLVLGQVMALGESKYGLTNWRKDRVSASVYYNAIMRHLLSWHDGENTDPESLVSHLGHVMACCSILLDAADRGQLNDDRPLPGGAADYIKGATR